MDAEWERLRAPEFWRWLLGGDVDFEEERSFDLMLPFGSGHGLRASVDEGMSATLSDLETGTELGWIDDAHFHPNCLRVDEALQVSAAQGAGRSKEALLLLLPFAVSTTLGDAERLRSAAKDAWECLGLEGQSPDVAMCSFEGERVEWYLDARRRWCLRQTSNDLVLRPLYTLRVEENADFPEWLSAIGR